MQGKSIVPLVLGLSLTVVVADSLAQPPGRGGRGRGGAQPAAEGQQPPATAPGRGGAPGGRFGGGAAGGAPAGRFGGSQGVNPLFAALDANGDGVITTAEMEGAIQAFAKLDENKDGKLTAEEAGATGGGHGHMHGRGAAPGGSSQTPAAGRGGRGRGGAGEGAPGAGRGRGGQAAGGAGDREADQPANPPVDQGNSKSPFVE